MKRKIRRIIALLLALVLTGSALAAEVGGSLNREELLQAAAQVELPVLFGSSETFDVDGVSFYSVRVSPAVTWLFEHSDTVVYPGQSGSSVFLIKQQLLANFGLNHFVSHTQLRNEVNHLLDDQLAVLIETVYLFCGVDREICLDDYSFYLLGHLISLSKDMQADIYTVYRYLLIQRGLDGSFDRTGRCEGLYYYAQTDSDWATYPFPNAASAAEANDDMQARAGGVMSLSMVAATYLHHEIDPLRLANWAIENGYRVESHGVPDAFFPAAAEFVGIPAPTIDYADDGIDWATVMDQMANQNALAIVHLHTGDFPAHYLTLQDYVQLDGVGYFLVANPGAGSDHLIYAAPEVLNETCSAVILFRADKTAWDLTVRAERPEALLPAATRGAGT